jgi:hypothetical protein
MSDTPTLANVAAPPPAATPQQTNSPFAQPIAPPGPGSAQPLKPPTPGSRAWAEARGAAAADPTATEWAHMTPDQRFAHESSTRDRQDRSGPGYVHTRDRAGNVVITERETGKIVDGDAPSGDQPAPPVAQGEKVKIGQYEVSEQEIGELMAEKAARDLRAATVPANPSEYKLTLPENLTLPGNAQFQFDEAGNKASFDAVKAWAHQRQMSQADFSEMMGLYASHHAAQEAMLAQRAQAEIQKSGPNASMRVDSVVRWIRSEVGDVDARPIAASLCTDAHLRFYERLMSKVTSQGTAPFSQQHRDRPDPGKVDDATWATWNDAQKFDYARSHSATERNYQLPQHR